MFDERPLPLSLTDAVSATGAPRGRHALRAFERAAGQQDVNQRSRVLALHDRLPNLSVNRKPASPSCMRLVRSIVLKFPCRA
jgi:hypothetical protein